AASILDLRDFLPAVGQGAIGIETRTDDTRVRELLAAVNHPATATALRTERAFLARLDGSCRTPVGGLATGGGAEVRFEGIIATPDGTRFHRAARTGAVAAAAAMGHDAGAELARLGGPDFFTGG